MALKAGFAQVDITPPVGGWKLSWSHPIKVERIVEPICANVVVLDDGARRAALVSHDLAAASARLVQRVRELTDDCLPGGELIVAATHNHAAPGLTDDRPIETDVPYTTAEVGGKIAGAVRQACDDLRPVEMATCRGVEGRAAFVRRCVMRDGTVRSQPRAGDPAIRCVESVIDPELGVVAFREPGDGAIRGLIVNHALHPTQFGGDETVQRGWPGRMFDRLRGHFGEQCITIFLNGAFGDVHAKDRLDPAQREDVDFIGRTLADHAARLVGEATFTSDIALSARRCMAALPFRDPDKPYGPHQMFLTPEVVARARQRFDAWRAGRTHYDLELTAIMLGDATAFVSVGCELFTRLGLAIKQRSAWPHTFVVGNGNDAIGYMPFADAFAGGGYECTFPVSRFKPESGDILVDAGVGMLNAAGG